MIQKDNLNVGSETIAEKILDYFTSYKLLTGVISVLTYHFVSSDYNINFYQTFKMKKELFLLVLQSFYSSSNLIGCSKLRHPKMVYCCQLWPQTPDHAVHEPLKIAMTLNKVSRG